MRVCAYVLVCCTEMQVCCGCAPYASPNALLHGCTLCMLSCGSLTRGTHDTRVILVCDRSGERGVSGQEWEGGGRMLPLLSQGGANRSSQSARLASAAAASGLQGST